MNQIANSFLSSISDILFYPVLIALLLSLVWIVYQTGVSLREAWQRSRNQFLWAEEKLNALEKKASTAKEKDIELEKIIQTSEKQAASRLNQTRFSIRSGPTLGLMGTLIPMAEALLGLSKGNLPALASNSSTAFSTTVLGLAIGLIAYTLTVVRERWIRSDLQTITFRAEELLRNIK
ncbi:outer membrane transport energization protein ExbB [Chitinophaga sp. YR573]|uniref:MotA/TolQ/ExbB proton channel family protein n=1 Tax=Chitinophaga sp. YR573 TaxID=1881040 RepID=UPI0008C49D9E|nr:MotA/TolQ/ExbB proton channel family protein [Chitinophaga sp. YR573]SEW40151.1 outer membrane transport energization protein ExbB [Chitinophaga sp. YR573]